MTSTSQKNGLKKDFDVSGAGAVALRRCGHRRFHGCWLRRDSTAGSTADLRPESAATGSGLVQQAGAGSAASVASTAVDVDLRRAGHDGRVDLVAWFSWETGITCCSRTADTARSFRSA
jgi:hypothetical protein